MIASGQREAEAIFVVGISRSGTTLMRNILEGSDRIAIARENHFMGHLLAREGARVYFRRLGDLRSDQTVRRLVQFIYSGEFQRRSRLRPLSPFWRWLTKDVPAAELERRLLAGERTERGVFTVLLRAYADHRGRPVMGEKTPAHLRYVDTLLEWFPDGRVLHMVRDPRAVYVSDLHRRRQERRRPYGWLRHIPLAFQIVLLLQVTWTWADAMRRHHRLAERWAGRYRLARFEDVVTQPATELPAIFQFLGVEPPADLTQVTVRSQGLRAQVSGIEPEAATRWQRHIGRPAERWLTFWLRGPMRRLGYAGVRAK